MNYKNFDDVMRYVIFELLAIIIKIKNRKLLQIF